MNRKSVQAAVCLIAANLALAGCGGKSDDTDGNDSGNNNQTPARLSALGESCARTADCATKLVCINLVCVSGPMASEDGGTMGDGGTQTQVGPRLGQRGESCVVPRDCADGLTCRPSTTAFSPVCDYATFPFQPTGKDCEGECNSAADCCELPVGYMGFGSCEDLSHKILMTLGGTSVATACANPGTEDAHCFAYSNYCNCAAGAWSCNSNHCVYSAACQFSGVTSRGCADQTRTGASLVTNCDTTAMKCQVAAAMAECTNPTTCDGKAFADLVGTCQTGECTCYQSACYRRCTKDLDCAAGYTCDETNSVCTPAGQCDTDAYCAGLLHNVGAHCQNKACVVSCLTSYDCNGSGLMSPFNDMVCNSSGVCESVGCSSDAECVAASGVKMFCVTPATGMATATARSAITDGR